MSCSPVTFIQKYVFYLKSSFYLTKHHGDVIPQVVDIAPACRSSKTVSSSDDVFVGDESSPASVGLVGLGGSQEQQSSPGELSDISLLPANNSELIINMPSSI